ncbi:Qa-SNARE protein [Angomonas deanei]|uniref:Sec20, putative n=1 Tax=Angomonas deanei TaxID=59799 RepID=A0A7G2CPG6_9TRYP|nr:Qa-SNARE protein [Angomonas deanei]CAD2221738.1 Sec20, putative [Angomonas deanei]|eukprot:EPY38893.1 Qa-SNARE protein [Angomonas deanei]
MGDEADSAYYGELVKKHNTRIGELRGSMAKLKEKCETAQQDSFHPPTAQKESNDTTTTTNNNNNNNGEGRFSVWSPTEGGEEEAGADPSRVEARHAAGRINTIQHQTLQSLGNTETMLNETETVGQEAAVTLRKQTEQIEKTNEGLEEMHGEIGRAGKELKGFMRRMARDRIIIFFSIAIVVCLIVVVILAVLKHKWNK